MANKLLPLGLLCTLLVSCSDSTPVDTIVDLGLTASTEQLQVLRENAWCGNLQQRDHEVYFERYRFQNPEKIAEVTEWNKVGYDLEGSLVVYKQGLSKEKIETTITPINPAESEQIKNMIEFAELDPSILSGDDAVAIRLTQAENRTLDLVPCVAIDEDLNKAADSEYYNYYLNLQSDKSAFHVQPLTFFPTQTGSVGDLEGSLFCQLNEIPKVVEINDGKVLETVFPNLPVSNILLDPDTSPDDLIPDSAIISTEFQEQTPDRLLFSRDGGAEYFSIAQDILGADLLVYYTGENIHEPRRSQMYFPCDSYYADGFGISALEPFIETMKNRHQELSTE